jgi:hypothetical protein
MLQREAREGFVIAIIVQGQTTISLPVPLKLACAIGGGPEGMAAANAVGLPKRSTRDAMT